MRKRQQQRGALEIMGNYSKILVAFDGSDSSRNALRQAVSRFEQSWIKVLIVLPAYEGDLELVGVRDLEGLFRGPRDDLVKAAREITGADAARVKINVEKGEAYERIVDVARQEKCSLIVVGRRGLHRLERMLMGSVTAKVIVHAAKDVLVVPRDSAIEWDNILLAIDGSPFSDAALERAMDFAKTFDGGITAVSVVDIFPENYADAAEVVEKMEEKAASVLSGAGRIAKEAGVKLETQLLHGDPAEEITAFARQHNTGIIFLGSKGRSGLKKIFMGSVAQKVIGLSPCPVYVAKPV